MDAVIDLETWRRRRAGWHGSEAEDDDDPSVVRLEQAIERLHALVSASVDRRGRLQRRIETELLAIMGELSVGLIDEAALRAERLATRLVAGTGGGLR